MRERSLKVKVTILKPQWASPLTSGDYSTVISWITMHGYDHVMGSCDNPTCIHARDLITSKQIILGKDYLR